ncbi:MAG: thiamine pyrophosphate-dependent enzyme [Victivallales bacterium]
MSRKRILSGDEAVAYGALAASVRLGSGYPGTPSTEILETLAKIGGAAEWAPNEKVALEVGIGVSFGGGRSIVTMKHVGLNVAADPLFTLTYTGVNGGLVIVSADDPGLASSQNEQDNRNYAKAAKMLMLEPADSQEAYDFTIRAFELSERFNTPVLLRMTTRVCHSQTVVDLHGEAEPFRQKPYVKNIQKNVMVPAFAKKAHVRLENTMKELAEFAETSDLEQVKSGSPELGVICSGIAWQHVCEAAPEASVLKLGLTWPLPMKRIAEFAGSVKRCVVIEEGDRFLADAIAAAGVKVEAKDESLLFGELNVNRVRKQLERNFVPDPAPVPGRPPQLCLGCPHRKSFETLRDLGCIVSGDIGCYTLGTLPPFSAIDMCVCMGASIGVGLGLRRSLPENEARKVVSVIGDSTFLHSGITGIVEMVYNRPATGHLVIILDNSTTAMTGLQENPATGHLLNMDPAAPISLEALCRACGVDHVDILDTTLETERFKNLVQERLNSNDVSVIIARRPCILQMKKMAKFAKKSGGAK